jgi:hypothetical protein
VVTLEDGGTIDLSGLNNAGTDDQNISGSGLAGNILTIGIEGGSNETVDLSSIAGGVSVLDDLTDVKLANAHHSIFIANGSSAGGAPITGSLSSSAYSNLAIGKNSLNSITTGDYNVALGYYALNSNTNGSNNFASGSNAMRYQTTSSDNNLAIGYQAMQGSNGLTSSADANTAIGYRALYSITGGDDNTAIGYQSSYSTTTGIQNVSIGKQSLLENETGNRNIAIGGFRTLWKNETGSDNIGMGYYAGSQNVSGSYNINIGYYAGGNNVSGSRNVFIGNNAGKNETGSDKLYIANNATTPLIYGDFAAGKVGIGTTSPSNIFHIDMGDNWDAMSLQGTNDRIYHVAIHENENFYIGDATEGATPFTIEAGATGSNALWLDNTTNVGIGTTTPSEKLHVSGKAKVSGGIIPDYDSGWFSVSKANYYTKTHNLGSQMLRVEVYIKDGSGRIFNASAGQGVGLDYGGSYEGGTTVYMKSTTQVEIGFGNDALYIHDNTSLSSGFSKITTGTCRLLIWKTGL